MKNQTTHVSLSLNEIDELINYLKSYSDVLGNSYQYAKDIVTQHQIATTNFDVNKMIKKLKNYLEKR